MAKAGRWLGTAEVVWAMGGYARVFWRADAKQRELRKRNIRSG